MSTRWYTGSCQCGRVKFEAALDDDKYKAKADSADPNAFVLVRPSAFRLVDGDKDLSDVQFGLVFGLNRFCKFCGVRVFGKGHMAKLGGDFCVVAVAAVDGLVEDLDGSLIECESECASMPAAE